MHSTDSLLATCDESPVHDGPHLVYADWLAARGDPRGEMLRLGCALRQQVRDLVFPDAFGEFHDPQADSRRTLEGLRTLERDLRGGAVTDAGEIRQRYLALFQRNVPLNPERLGETLRQQYHLQVSLLRSLGLVEERDGQLGITALDARFHPVLSFAQVLERLRPDPCLQQKLRQGFDTLLLVPFGLPLPRFIEAWREGLRRNSQTPESPIADLDQDQPVCVWDSYDLEKLVYFPRRFAADHGGRTKEQLLSSDPADALQVLLVEGGLTNLPRQGQGQTVGGRRQIECGRMPQEYLASFPEGEIGWTPETYIVRFLDALERQGQVLDRGTLTYLTSAYLSAFDEVPFAYWYPCRRRAFLGASGPAGRCLSHGVRPALRVR